MAKQNVSQLAKANGVNPMTAHGRIYKGWSVAAATSTPTRKYKTRKYKRKAKSKADAVWAHLVTNPLARPADVARSTGASYAYVWKLMSKVGTPREVFELEAAGATTADWKSLTPVANDDTSVGKTIGNYIRRWWKAA